MDDLVGKIGELLQSPEGMEKLKAVASMFAGAGGEQEEPAPSQEGADTLSSLISTLKPTLGGLGAPGGEAREEKSLVDPGMILKLAPIISKLNETSKDPKVKLLYSLRPFLKEERQENLEMAITFLKFSQIADLFGDIL